MRIGLVALGSGGMTASLEPESPVAALATSLVALGHDVSVLVHERAVRDSGRVHDAMFRIRPLAGFANSASDIPDTVDQLGLLTRALGRELEMYSYDLVHSHGWLAGLAAQLTAPRHHIPVAHTFHQLLALERPGEGAASDARLRAERACTTHVDRLIVTSTFVQEVLLRSGVPRRRVTVIPPGVSPVLRASMPSEVIGTGRPAPRLVAFGPASRVADVLRALPSLPGARLLVCGTPSHPISESSAPITTLATALGVTGRVRLEQGDTARDRVPLIRGSAIALCMSSPAGAGTEQLEAMALGVPVIAGNVVAAEAVIDGVTGLHAVNVAPRDLARTVLGLLHHPVVRTQMSMAGHDRAMNRYSWERIAAETQLVYEQLVAGRPGPRCTQPAASGGPSA